MHLKDLTTLDLARYKESLTDSGFSLRSVNRKLSSLRRFLKWAIKKGYVDPKLQKITGTQSNNLLSSEQITKAAERDSNQIIDLNQSIKITRSTFVDGILNSLKSIPKSKYAPLFLSHNSWSFWKKLLFHLKFTRPRWYKTYTSQPLTHYLHFAILIIFTSFLGFGLYQQLFEKAPTPFALTPGTSSVIPKRLLSFQGRLTDSSGNLITSKINMRFAIYNDETASGGAKLWEESRSVTPDEDGVFNLFLGEVTSIPSTLFSENPNLWLGVTVDGDSEAKPRQRIVTVGFAENAEFLQGHPPSASLSANQIPVMTQSGDLYIAQNNPRIYSASGNFTIRSQSISIETENSGDMTLRSDRGGRLLIRNDNTRENTVDILNSSIVSGNLISGYGGNDNTGFNLLYLSSGSSPVQRFIVDYAGNASASGDLVIGGIDTSPNISTTNMRPLTIGNTSTGAVLLAPSGTTALTAAGNDITIADTLAVYGTTIGLNADENQYNLFGIGAAAGAAGENLFWGDKTLCDASETNCGWALASVAGTNYWQRNSQAISPLNITDDLLIGLTATPSSSISDYFQIFGTGSTTGDASSSGILTLGTNRSAGVIETERMIPLTIGSSTTGPIQLSPKGTTGLTVDGAGNVGIGTTNPGQELEVTGDILLTSIGNQLIFADDGYIKSSADTYVELQAVGILDFKIADRIPFKVQYTDVFAYANLIVNEDGANNYSLRAEGDTDANLLYTDPANDRVGIGTSAPTAKLDVAGDASSSGSLVLRGTSPTTLDILNGSRFDIQTSVGGDDGLSPVLTVLNTGDVGIGTTSPQGKLHVSGAVVGKALAIFDETGDQNILTASASGTTVANLTRTGDLELKGQGDLRLYDADNSNYTGFQAPALSGNILYTLPTADGTANQVLSTNASGTLSWIDATPVSGTLWQRNLGALSPINITDDLLVGGIASPSASTSDYFQVFGTGSNAGDASSSGILTLGTNRSAGIIETERMLPLTLGSATTGSVYLSPKGTTGLFVNGAGNVGIGTTGPTSLLNVKGSLPTLTIQDNGWDNSRKATLLFAYREGISNSASIQSNVQPGSKVELLFNTWDGSFTRQRMVIQGDGNVGIGTTGPEDLLEIQGAEATDAILTLDADDGDDTTDTWEIRSDASDNQFYFTNGTSDLVTIQSGGNVGIGTTGPQGKLHVSGAVVGKALSIFDETGDQNILTASASGTTVANLTRTGDLELKGQGDLRLYESDNTHYTGFQAPTLAGNVLYTLPTADGTANQVLATNASGVLSWIDATAVSGTLWQRNLGALSPMNITDDLLIGVTATPSSSISDYFQVFGTGSTAGDASSSGILTLGTNRVAGIIETERMLPLTIGSSTTGPIQLSPKGTTGLFVDGSGNVGIGTTSPGANLEVYGDAPKLRIQEDSSSSYNFDIQVNYTSANPWTISGYFGHEYLRASGDDLALEGLGGNVGIGTTAPDKKLSLWGGDASIADATDLGSESLTEGTFTNEPGAGKWGVSGGWDVTFAGNAANFDIAGGAGNLTQTAADMAIAGVGYRWYKFVYTVSNAASSPAATITTVFASSATSLTLTDGAQTTYFKAAASPGTFTINATAGVFTLDGISLTEVQGGDLAVHGILTGGGTSGIKILANGNVGIGTTTPLWRLHVSDSQTATASALIENTAANNTAGHTGLIVKMGTQDITVNADDRFINFMSGEDVVGKIQGTATAGVISYTTEGVDFGEYFTKADNNTYEEGDVISLTSGGSKTVNKSRTPYDGKLLGVASSRSGFTGGREGSDKVQVGLIGQIPVKIASNSEPIVEGDVLTSSSETGKAMKATKAGQIIGKALENWPKECNNEAIEQCNNDKIWAYINPSWYDPDVYLTSTGDLEIKHDGDVYDGLLTDEVQKSPPKADPPLAENIKNQKYILKINKDEIASKIGLFAEIAVATVKSGLLEAENIIVNNRLIAKRITVEEKLVSPLIETDQLIAKSIVTDQIKPVSGDLVVDLSNLDSSDKEKSGFGKLLVKGNLETTGDASVAGELTAQSGQFNNVTIEQSDNATDESKLALDVRGDSSISGTLYANRIISNETVTQKVTIVERIEEIINKVIVPDQTNDLYAQTVSASGSATLSYEELLALLDEAKQSTTEDVKLENLNGDSLSFSSSLYVYGQANLAEANVLGNITQGSTFQIAGGNSINVLTGTLYLQNSGNGIDLADGAFTIDEKGNALFAGNVVVKGDLAVNTLKPASGDLTIDLGNSASHSSEVAEGLLGRWDEHGKSGFGKLLVHGVNDREVFSLDASGSATFTGQLTADSLQLSSDYSATDSGLIIASAVAATESGILAPAIKTNGTTGVGLLPAGETQVVIFNNSVSNKKLIYLTPTSDTQNKVVYVRSKKEQTDQPGYFVVAIDSPIDNDISFNWWIIN